MTNKLDKEIVGHYKMNISYTEFEPADRYLNLITTYGENKVNKDDIPGYYRMSVAPLVYHEKGKYIVTISTRKESDELPVQEIKDDTDHFLGDYAIDILGPPETIDNGYFFKAADWISHLKNDISKYLPGSWDVLVEPYDSTNDHDGRYVVTVFEL